MADWSGTPAYKQVAAALRQQITDGRLEIGAQLPSISDLMTTYNVSITVVRQALSQLRAEGLITSHQGKGSFVHALPHQVHDPAHTSHANLAAVMDQLAGVADRLDQMNDRLNAIDQRLDHIEGSTSQSRPDDR